MADDRTITIGIDVDPDGAVRGIKRVEGAAVDLEQEGGDSGMSFGETMNFALGELAASAARELGNQIGTLISQGRALLGRAAEINETQSKFNTVFGQSSRQVQEFVESQAQLMGLTQQRAQELVATAGSVAQGAGLAKEESADMSVEIAQLAGDLASFNNAKPQRTFEAITSALTGEREQLKQFGIVLQENMVQQRALANTSKESAEALTQQEKAAATLELAYDKAGEAVGDLERTSESAANTGRQAGAAWREVRDTFAKELLPAAAEINQELLELAENEEVMQATREAAKALSKELTTGIRLASEFFQLFAENRESIATAADATFRLVAATSAYVTALKAYRLWTKRAVIAQKALNVAMRTNVIGAVITGFTTLLPLLQDYVSGTRHGKRVTADYRDRLAETKEVVDELSKSTKNLTESERELRLERLKEQRRKAREVLEETGVELREARQKLENMNKAQQQGARVSATYISKLQSQIEALEKQRSEAFKTIGAVNEQIQSIEKSSQTTEDNTENIEGNTEAVNENAQAREEAANAPPAVPPPEVEEPKNQVIEPDVSFDMESIISGAESAEQVLRAGLIESINEADTAIRELQDAYDSATTDKARSEIQAMIDKLKSHRDEMEATKKEVLDLGPALEKGIADSLTAFAEGVGDMVANAGDAEDVGRQVLTTLADLAKRVGQLMIGFGVSGLALQSLVSNPATAIAAGAALVALASAAKSAISSEVGSETDQPRGSDEARREANVPSFQEGVENFEGGLARVHEDELLVNLAPGTSVLPSMTMPRSPTITTGAVQRAASGGGASAADMEGLESKLDEVAQRFEEKQFRLRGRDQVTQQERQQAIYDDAGIK